MVTNNTDGIADGGRYAQPDGSGAAMQDSTRQGSRGGEPAGIDYLNCFKASLDGIDSHANVQRMRFISAAMSGDINAMREHVKALPSVDAPDPWGTTPLAFVVTAGNREAVAELLSMGADPLRMNRAGRSPLDNAMDAQPPMEDIANLLKRAAGLDDDGRHRHAWRDETSPDGKAR